VPGNIPISGILLAGGRARRLGGQDKGLIELAGRTLAARTLERLAPQVDEVLISANRHLEAYAALGARVVPDALPDFQGPLAGIAAAARQARHDWLLAVPCDVPFLPPDLAARLLGRALERGARLARAADPAQVHYTVMLLHRGLVADLEAELAQGRLRVQAWQARHACETVRFADPGAFLNINTPEDLLGAERRLAGHG